MKSFKKAFALFLVIAMFALVAGGCKASTSSSTTSGKKAVKDLKIGISIGTTTQERWVREIEMFRAYAKKAGFTVLIQDAQNDATKQTAQCENLITQGVDVLIVQSLDASACGPIVTAAHESKIKVIAYDRFIMNADLDYYVTFDSEKVGEDEAQFVVNKAPKGNYIWLLGDPQDNNAKLVEQGQAKILNPLIASGDIKIILKQACINWDPNNALKIAENGLTLANNNIQGVVASNDGTAGGAVQALTAQKLSGKVPICGQDADLAACQRIVEGTQTGTVYKPLLKLNTATMELAVALGTGKDKSVVDSTLGSWQSLNNNTKDVDSFTVKVTSIDKSNMDAIIIKQDKFQTLEDVYKNVPKDQWPAN